MMGQSSSVRPSAAPLGFKTAAAIHTPTRQMERFGAGFLYADKPWTRAFAAHVAARRQPPCRFTLHTTPRSPKMAGADRRNVRPSLSSDAPPAAHDGSEPLAGEVPAGATKNGGIMPS